MCSGRISTKNLLELGFIFKNRALKTAYENVFYFQPSELAPAATIRGVATAGGEAYSSDLYLDQIGQALGRISNAQLHTAFTRRFYLRPINPLVLGDPYYLVVWEISS